jgi:hypothetical protein
MIYVLVGLAIFGGGAALVAYTVKRIVQQPLKRLPPRRRGGRPPSWPAEGGSFDDDDLPGDSVSDQLMRMADRYDNSGDTSSAEAAREAAERARSESNPAEAHRVASEYLSSVDAVGVASLLTTVEVASSSSDAGSSSGSDSHTDGGASWSDNS